MGCESSSNDGLCYAADGLQMSIPLFIRVRAHSRGDTKPAMSVVQGTACLSDGAEAFWPNP